MKILQVNCVYNKGSTGKITYDIHTELQKQGIESVVCYGRGELVNEPHVYKTCPKWYSKLNNALSRVTGIMYGGCFFSTNKLISIIKKEKPDIVHLQCINGYFVNIYRLITWMKEHHIRTILTLHAEFMYTANCGHAFECEKWITGCGQCPRCKQETKSLFFDMTKLSWNKMRKAFAGFDSLEVTSVSPWLMERAKQSSMLADKHHSVILNGINTDIFKPQPFDEFRKRLGIKDEVVIAHVTANFDSTTDNIKGGMYVVKLAKKLKENGVNAKIVIAANQGKAENLPDNIIYLGRTQDQLELAQLYSMANVTVLTSKRETFSMVTAESLCCGTPVVGFKAGGPERIALPEFSQFVMYGDINGLYKETVQYLSLKQKDIACVEKACATYSKAVMCSSYMKIYKGMK